MLMRQILFYLRVTSRLLIITNMEEAFFSRKLHRHLTAQRKTPNPFGLKEKEAT